MYVRDTYQNKVIQPPKLETPHQYRSVDIDQTAIPLKGPPKKADSALVFQMEKDFAKIREQQLEEQMHYEENMQKITVDERFK